MRKYKIDRCNECMDMLKKDKNYRNIFRIFCSHETITSVEFKLDGEIKKLSFADMEFVSEYCGDKIIEILKDVPKGFVCLKLANCPEWFGIFWGILLAGYKPFLVDARHDENLTKYFLDESGAVAIISTDNYGFEGVKCVDANEIIKLGKRTLLEVSANADRTSKTREERIMSYDWGDEVALCTSGTTSTAKIFVYNGETMANQIENAREEEFADSNICGDEEKRNLCFLPLNHLFGFMANYIWFGFFGSSMVMPDKIAPSVLLSTCRDHHVTHILAVPLLFNNIAKGIKQKIEKQSKFKQFMFNRMLDISLFAQKIEPNFGISVAKKLFGKSVLSNLAGDDIICLISGGGHVLPETLRIVNGIGYYTICGFGMTEVGVSSMENRRKIKHRLAGCVGLPCSSIEYKIVPLNDNDDSVGELVMRGSSIHSAMLKNGGYAPAAVDEEGWFRTGDIGRLTNGALYIEGRLKEVIINESGENVYPDELEDMFLGIGGISQFTVLGIKKSKDSPYEDIVFVGQVADNVLGDKDKIEKIRLEIAERNGGLPVYKKLGYILLTADELPLSNGIKIRRAVIKKQVEGGEGNYLKIESLKK